MNKPMHSTRRALIWATAALLLLSGCAEHVPHATAAIAEAIRASDAGKSDPAALKLLVEAIDEHKLVLLGEMHGTREIPALVGELVERYIKGGGEVVLALEISTREQAWVDRYLGSAGASADRDALLAGEHWQDQMHDGRDSEAMLALIEQVRQLRGQADNVSIVLFDPGDDACRNQQMAENLRAIAHYSPQATLLVLTGNVHAMTSAPPWEMFDGGKRIDPPMTAGRFLSDLHPLSINIGAASGDMWVCMDGECGAHPVLVRGDAGAEPTLERTKPAESAWDATLILPRFRASPPAVRTSR